MKIIDKNAHDFIEFEHEGITYLFPHYEIEQTISPIRGSADYFSPDGLGSIIDYEADNVWDMDIEDLERQIMKNTKYWQQINP